MGLSRFADPVGGADSETGGEPSTEAKDPLPFAARRAAAVSDALGQFGYKCTTADEATLPTADELGTAVRSAITAGGTGDVQVVHVLSHGKRALSGLHVVGADGEITSATNVAQWVAEIEDYPDKPRPHTLFLIDTCEAGDAARLAWRQAAEPSTRAWVIAATEPGKLAYDGRFSQAAATILARIASGDIDLYPGGEYVAFGDVVELIRWEVARLGGQYVTSTPVDGRAAPPFSGNPRQPTDAGLARAKQNTDTAVVPFLDLDVALDAAHFLDRAAGHRFGADLDVGCFTGRGHELTALARWLDDDAPGSLRVVTGGAGSGKSALLGILVCAAHPGLRGATERLWRAAQARLPRENPRLAAVHLRERDLPWMLAALIRQLHLPLPATGTDPGMIIDAIARRADQPVIVADALDEATAQDAIMTQLLVPLARAARADGTPACRLLVGVRPWGQFRPLRDLAHYQSGLIDLDQIPPERLRGELQDYVNDLLSLVSYPLPSRRALKEGVAAALTAPDRERGGEFLAAALYIHWLTGQYPDGVTQDQAADLAGRVPRTFPELLGLDLETHADHPWPRAVLTAVAYAHGAGMPATVITRLAQLFRNDKQATALGIQEFGRVLERIRFYLRSSPDTDGTTLYRLFHQGLADHLHTATADLSALLDRLLITAPLDEDGQRRWEAAEPYVRRHATGHAVDAGRLDELIQADPEVLQPHFNTVATPEGRLAAAVYRQSLERYRAADAISRRDLLAINATRYAARELVTKLALVPGLPTPRWWWPEWATGGQLAAPLLAMMTGHTGPVDAVACTTLDGRPVAVTGARDGTVRVWDLASGRPHGRQLSGQTAPVRAIACTTLHGRTVAVMGGTNGTVHVWDVASGQPQCDPMTAHAGSVDAVACTTLHGRPIAVTAGSDRAVRVWDLNTGQPRGGPLTGSLHDGHDNSGDADDNAAAYTVAAVACTTLEGGPAAVTGGDYRGRFLSLGSMAAFQRIGVGTVQVWDLATAHPCVEPMGGEIAVTAVTCTMLDGRPVAVTGERDGTVRVWDLTTGQARGEWLTGHTGEVTTLACTTLGDRQVAVSGGNDGMVRVWDLASGRAHGGPLTGDFRTVSAMDCTTLDGHSVAVTGGEDSMVRVWDLAAGHARGGPPVVHTSTVFSVACTIVDRRPVAVTSGRDATVRVWDLATGRARGGPLTGHTGWARAVACAMVDGHPVAVTGGGDGTVRVWDLATGRARGGPLTGHFSTVFAVACGTLDGCPVAVSGGFDGTVRVWDLATGRARGGPLTGHTSWVRAVACTMLNGRLLAVSAGVDAAVRVWDLATAQPRGAPLTGHTDEVTTLACTTLDGHPVAVSSGIDGTVRVWDLATGRARGAPLTAHTGTVWAVGCTMLNDHPVAVTGGQDGTVRTWDLTEHCETAVRLLPDDVHALALTPDGDLVVGFGAEICMLRRYLREMAS